MQANDWVVMITAVVAVVGLTTAVVQLRTAQLAHRRQLESEAHRLSVQHNPGWVPTVAVAVQPQAPLPDAGSGAPWWTNSNVVAANEWPSVRPVGKPSAAAAAPMPDSASDSPRTWWNDRTLRDALAAEPALLPPTATELT